MILVANLTLQTFVESDLFSQFVFDLGFFCYEGRRIEAVFSLKIEYEIFVLVLNSAIGCE